MYICVRGVCNFLGSVSSQQKRWTSVKALGQALSQLLGRSVLQLCVAAQFYLENKGKYILEAWGHADPKDTERRERPPAFWLLFLYVFFSSPWACPMWTGLTRSAVCSTWGPHSGPRTFLCSVSAGFSLPCLLATAILDSFFLFQLPNRIKCKITTNEAGRDRKSLIACSYNLKLKLFLMVRCTTNY